MRDASVFFIVSARSHLWLRVGALGLLVMMAVWPRAKTGVTAAELGSVGQDVRAGQGTAARARVPSFTSAASNDAPSRGTTVRTAVRVRPQSLLAPVPASAGTASAPPMVVADADESHLTN